jgi:hypothetical protein
MPGAPQAGQSRWRVALLLSPAHAGNQRIGKVFSFACEPPLVSSKVLEPLADILALGSRQTAGQGLRGHAPRMGWRGDRRQRHWNGDLGDLVCERIGLGPQLFELGFPITDNAFPQSRSLYSIALRRANPRMVPDPGSGGALPRRLGAFFKHADR